MAIALELIVTDFARGMELADARRPAYKTYQPGLGPHTEPLTVALVMAELAAAWHRSRRAAQWTCPPGRRETPGAGRLPLAVLYQLP